MSPVSGEGSPKGCSSPDKLSHDSDSSDSGSKGSSTLTNSEQRSHEEANSSLKESDNASSVSGSSKEKNVDVDTASDSEQQLKVTRGMLMKLFVPIKIDFVAMPMQDPVWIQEANFSSAVQMTYTKDSADLNMTLTEDQKTLTYCPQPDLVKEQLDELVMSLNSGDSEKNEDSSSGGECSKNNLERITEEKKEVEKVETQSKDPDSMSVSEDNIDNPSEQDSKNNGSNVSDNTESKGQEPLDSVETRQVEAMQEGSQDEGSTTNRLVTPEESSATSGLLNSQETPEEAAITTAVINMEIDAKPPPSLPTRLVSALTNAQTSSSDDDNFRQPSIRRRVPKSRQSGINKVGSKTASKALSRDKNSTNPQTSGSSSSGCSPSPLVKLEKTESPECNEFGDLPSSVNSDTWEQLRHAVKSSMSSMFEGKDGADSAMLDKKDSQGQSVVTSSERSSELSAFACQPATVEELMEQLFKSDDPFESIEMD